MASDREAAIQEFTDAAEMERRLSRVLAKILEGSPQAVLIAWEENHAIHITSVPHSMALVRGLTEMAYQAVFKDEISNDESDD